MKYLFLVLLGIACFYSCDKEEDMPPEIEETSCLDEIIAELGSPDFCENSNISSYSFLFGVVYVVDVSSCIPDGATPIYDSECALICNLGTIAGITDCLNIDFYENAEFIEVVWEP